LEKGKIELRGDLEKAQAELDKEVNIEIDGKKANLKELIGEVGQGLEKVMDGFGDISNGFGKGISEIIIKNTTFQVDFRDNGELAVSSDNQHFNFSSKKLTWEAKDGKLLIKGTGQNKDNFSFDLKAKNDKEWELSSEQMTLVLNKIK
jgi:hypothetical protein